MEEMTVVSFFVDRNGIAYKERANGVQERKYYMEKDVYTFGPYCVNIISVWLPFWEREDRLWSEEIKREYFLNAPWPVEGQRVCHVCDTESAILFGLKPGILSVEWGLFILEQYGFFYDGIVIFEDREMDAGRLALQSAPYLPYVGVVTKDRWRWEEIEEYILEEYGYQMEVSNTFARLHPKGKKVLLWSGEEHRGLTPWTIPTDCLWLDSRVGGNSKGFDGIKRKKNINILKIEEFLHDFISKSCIVSEKKL